MRAASSRELAVTLVQSCFTASDYHSPESFRDKVLGLCQRVAKSRSAGRLVVFPALTGLWIPLLKGRRPASRAALAASLLLRHPLSTLAGLAGGAGIAPLFRLGWEAALAAWIEPFREAARRLGAYLCPGSSLVPPFDREALRGLQATGAGVYETSCLISPLGTILGWTRKRHPPPRERRLGVRAARAEEPALYHTELGRIGLVLCPDGFHETEVQQLDRLGCQLVIQPSANPLPWEAPPRRGMALTREEQWLGHGLGHLVQGRENIGAALSPMSVSSVLGRRDRGRSHVFLNPAKGLGLRTQSRLPESYRSYSGLAAIAGSCDQEEILTATLTGLP
ncbi:MAG: hypothetical protein JW820_02895 [Spirochaetales bacterium]|nr:hypothetical protein [Spirochaetales bacterium]